jgi:hypothetical protein
MCASDAESARLLLDAGADPLATDNEGHTTLMWAPDGPTAQLLIKAGVNVNATDNDGQTALMLACHPMMSECDQQALDKVKTLVAAGANIHAKDKEGKTAQDLAQEADYPQTAAFLQQSAKK